MSLQGDSGLPPRTGWALRSRVPLPDTEETLR